jgi:hypothetical protein
MNQVSQGRCQGRRNGAEELRVKDLSIQIFNSHLPVEAFAVAVFAGTSWFDVERPSAQHGQLFQDNNQFADSPTLQPYSRQVESTQAGHKQKLILNSFPNFARMLGFAVLAPAVLLNDEHVSSDVHGGRPTEALLDHGDAMERSIYHLKSASGSFFVNKLQRRDGGLSVSKRGQPCFI